jgi:hypothetical protein
MRLHGFRETTCFLESYQMEEFPLGCHCRQGRISTKSENVKNDSGRLVRQRLAYLFRTKTDEQDVAVGLSEKTNMQAEISILLSKKGTKDE